MANKASSEILIQVIKNEQQIKETILLNMIKMFIARGIISHEHLVAYHDLAIRNINQNDETVIPLDKDEIIRLGTSISQEEDLRRASLSAKARNEIGEKETARIPNDIAVKFIGRKITTIKKVTDIETFMEKPAYKIVIASNIQQKAVKQILEYVNVELFYDYELKINLIDHDLIPKHRKLSLDEIEELRISYLISDKEANQMLSDDPIARYYNLRPGDIVEITRPSINAGWAKNYRLVVDGVMIR
jgi:DNA-directed RNA polymerase subunit H (RpoH/RPB5)